MLDILLDSTHDIDTNALDMQLVSGSERVRQQLEIKLRLWRGEWFLDTGFGTPYLQTILGKQLTLSGAVAALRKSILEVNDVVKIAEFEYNYSRQQRTLTVDFSVETPFGIVEVVV